WCHVAVLVSPERYPEILKELQEKGGLDDSTRQELASEAFALTSNYDTLISQWFQSSIDSKKTTAKSEKVQGATKEKLPEQIRIDLKREQLMRYGENPHQAAAYYQMAGEEQFGLNACKQLHGKKLSFNNLIDADIALTLPLEFEEPCVAILKHTTPSGVAVADSLAEAEAGARACDPVSAFGGIIGMNRVCDEKTAKQISKAFTEVIVAPGYTPEALNILVKKKNQRILEIPPDIQLSTGWDMRRIGGGLLIQDQDTGFPELDELKVVTKRQPTEEEWKDIRFAWVIVKYVKSNAVLFAKNGKTLGMGAGQMSRVDAVRLACLKAEDANLDLAGSVLASDAFFPFPDGLEQAGNAGAKTVIQPGGSVRDQEVIDAADKMGIAMVLTGRRHFRHA
ncbi:MAG: bifunctional phosphoribosylaminoimidazolecarboxamide formyltransferase/IMP cyclohydrolase, partial [Candidatus Electryonea clarkiae]|nr:bifunctional phosphoribosylaminoimidazolecarboxamide formyltransferase/IMP cyclohydrolase [Candidatus Electryonea clarkiae]